MSFNGNDDDTFTHLADEERRRAERNLTSSPLLRLLLVVVVVAGVIAAGGLLIRSYLHDREVSSYTTYIEQVTAIIKDSDRIGAELSKLLKEPGDATRKDVQTKLDQHQQAADRLTEQAKALSTPEDMHEAHQLLIFTMQLRSRGLQNLKPSLLNALEVQDVEVSSEQISRSMQLLGLSDLLYEEFFVTKAAAVLKQHDVPGATVPSTDFIADESLADKQKIQEVLAAMKSSDTLQTVHGVALIKVVAHPAEKPIERDDRLNLQASDKLAFVVTVENQGNMSEKDVAVTLKLTPSNSTQSQIQTVKIPEIKAKEHVDVRISGINPTDYGKEALLRVDAGPVPGEKNQENNFLEAHVIFVL